MDIYIIDFETIIDKKEASSKIKKKELQHELSKTILNKILTEIYNISPEIVYDDKKPYIKNNPLFFSITHSENIIGIAVDKREIGFDIEYRQKKDFDKILKYIGYQNAQNTTEEDFFKLWTKYEAEYKSRVKNSYSHCFRYKNYICTTASKSQSKPHIYEIELGTDFYNEERVIIKRFDIQSSDILFFTESAKD